MKAQISIEYIIALIVFIVFVSFLLLQFYTQRPAYVKEMRDELLRSEAFQISELLVNDHGEPANWQSFAAARRIGLSDHTRNKTNLMSINKIAVFNNTCVQGGYDQIKNKIISNYDFSIYLKDLSTGAMMISCQPAQIVYRATNISIRRIVAFNNGGYGEMIIQMW